MDKGHHTWDIYVHYQRCPHCGFILESRQRGEHFTCPRCKQAFNAEKNVQTTFGPLLDDKHQTTEMDWS